MQRLAHAKSTLLISMLLILVATVSALAEEAPAPKEHEQTVIVQTKYLDVEDVSRLLQPLAISVTVHPDTNAVILRGKDLKVAMDLIEALDVPPEPKANIELTVFILGAATQSLDDGPLPRDLDTVTQELGKLFGYRSFTLLDTIFLRVRDGRGGRVDGAVNGGSGESRSNYDFGFNEAKIIPREDRNLVRLDGLVFLYGRNKSADNDFRASLRTDIEVREGQKAVVGKATPQGADAGKTLILVVEAKILR